MKVASSNDLQSAKALYIRAKEAYYNSGSAIMTDAEFDRLEDKIRELDPRWAELKKTGVAPTKIGKKSEVSLLVPMSSLDKIKADNEKAFYSWLKKLGIFGSQVHVSEKLDGSSVQLVYKKGRLVKMFTRGDGVIGKDISYFIPVLTTVPLEIDCDLPVLVLRCEAVIRRADYEKKWAGKFDSARAMASSILNRQDVHPALHDLRFVVLRVLKPLYSVKSGLEYAKSLGLEVVYGGTADIAKDDLHGSLVSTLEARREKSAYDIDGLVIFTNANKVPEPGQERPAYARAFKLDDAAQAVETSIVAVHWKPSAFGVLVPRAEIVPIQFGNVTVKHAALHNASWARDMGAGVGATVRVTRAGEIIPKIIQVLKKAKFKLPPKAQFGEYVWDENGTNIQLVDSDSSNVAQANIIARMFHALGLDSVSIGLAKKCVECGYDTPAKVLAMDANDFSQLPGVKSSATKFAAEVGRVRGGEFSVVQLMVASGCFKKGVGKTQLMKLVVDCPEVLTKTTKLTTMRAKVTEAVGPAFAGLFCEGQPKFLAWANENGLALRVDKPKKATLKDGPLKGQVGYWTGYRDKQEEDVFESLGGIIAPFGSKTTVLFHLPNGKRSGKLDAAAERGVLVVPNFSLWIRKFVKKVSDESS